MVVSSGVHCTMLFIRIGKNWVFRNAGLFYIVFPCFIDYVPVCTLNVFTQLFYSYIKYRFIHILTLFTLVYCWTFNRIYLNIGASNVNCIMEMYNGFCNVDTRIFPRFHGSIDFIWPRIWTIKLIESIYVSFVPFLWMKISEIDISQTDIE